MTAGALDRVFNLERGLLHTAWRLTAAPATVLREYLAGRTARYTHPAAYLVLAFTSMILIATRLGAVVGIEAGHGTAITLTLFVAAAARIVFFRSGLNYAEHLIATMYLFGHVALFFAVMVVFLAAAFRFSGMLSVAIIAVGAVVVACGYFAWGFGGVVNARRRWLGATGGIVTLIGGVALWGVALALALSLLRRAGLIPAG